MAVATLALLILVVVLLLALLMKKSTVSSPALDSRLDAFEKAQERTERAVREEVAQSRDELGKAAREQRQELTGAFKVLGESVENQLVAFAKKSGDKLDGIRAESATGGKQLREEVVAALRGITDTTTKTMGELANVQKGQLEVMSSTIGKLSESVHALVKFSFLLSRLQSLIGNGFIGVPS
jgi:DNA recombination protein RmuC